MVCNCFMGLCGSGGGGGEHAGSSMSRGSAGVERSVGSFHRTGVKLSGRAGSTLNRNGSLLMVCREGPTFITLRVGGRGTRGRARMSEVEGAPLGWVEAGGVESSSGRLLSHRLGDGSGLQGSKQGGLEGRLIEFHKLFLCSFITALIN